MKKKGKYLGEILVERGLISDGQLQMVIQEQMMNKKFLGAMMVEKGLITEEDLLKALAEQFGIESTRLADLEIDWGVAMSFPSSIITENKCLPVFSNDETLTMLISNPLDVWALDRIEKEASPRKLRVLLVTLSDMEEAIRMYRRHAIRVMMNKWKKDE